MLIKLDHIFKLLNGQTIKDGVNDFTLKTACIGALTMTNPNERISGEEKVRRAVLAETIYKAKNEIELDLDEMKSLKDLIGQHGSPLVVKQAWDILDPKTKN